MKKTATVKILDEINAVIVGLRVEEYKTLYDKFGFFSNGYNFKPAYTMGKWDGKVRLFSKTGVTSIHFLPEIIKDLKEFGYKIKLIDNRNPVTFDVPLLESVEHFAEYGVTLGDHQLECINALIENRGGIVVAGTGAGKSYILGGLVNHLYKHQKLKCLVIVPSKDLVTQTNDEVKVFGNDTGCYYGALKQLNKTHLVSTWQSLQNNPEIVGNYHAVFVDEAHGAKSDVLKNLLQNHAKNAIMISGVTGTLPKNQADLMQVKYVLGEVVKVVPSEKLINLGWLAKLKLKVINFVEDFSDQWEKFKQQNPEEASQLTYKTFKSSYFPDFESERKWLKKNKNRADAIASLISAKTKADGNSFVLVNGVEFGKKLQKLIPGSIFVYGQDESEVRKRVYSLFTENNDIIVIATFNLASTGLNIKRIFNLFLIDAGKSFIQIIQSIGRGLRKAHDKDSVNVYDISSDLKFSIRHCNERKKYYKEQKYPFTVVKLNYNDFIQDIEEGKDVDMLRDIVVY